jgi:hypothetical protein
MSQIAISPRGTRVPQAIYKQASTYQLGELTRTFKPIISNPLLIIAIVLGGIILDIIVLAAIAYFTGFVFYILLFFPLMVAFWAVRALRTFNVRCYVFKNGFIYARGRKYRVVRWDQIVAVFQKHAAGRYSSSHTYTVRVQEGREIQIGDAVNRVIDLGAMIQREVTKLLLPRAIASYKSGETLSFGKVNVNRQGVNNGKEMIPWDQIDAIEVRSGLIVVQKYGRVMKWSTVREHETPNVYILQNLVDYAVKNR